LSGNGQNPTQVGGVPPIRLEIVLDQTTGQIAVNGPINNPIFCYGLLEKARQAIANFEIEQAKQQRIVPATTLPFVRPA
jgi:hypothetical protein